MIKKILAISGIALIACTVPPHESTANGDQTKQRIDTVKLSPQFGTSVRKNLDKNVELKEALSDLNEKL